MNKLVIILLLLVSIISNSYAQSPSDIKNLNAMLSATTPSVRVAGQHGVLNVYITISDMQNTTEQEKQDLDKLITITSESVATAFSATLLSIAEQDLYDIGVRTMHIYFITLQGMIVYGNTSIVKNKIINFKT